MRLPVIREISLNYVEYFKHPSLIYKFLKNNVAKGTKNFVFKTSSNLSKGQCKVYIEVIRSVAIKITNSLALSSIWMDQQEFQQIMISYKYIKELKF